MPRYSRQRESIQDYLNTHRTHPTAEAVYLGLKKEFPNISLGTVYRNLNYLADVGKILRISAVSGPDRYDGNVKPHYHFICSRCGRVLDIDLKPQTMLNKLANEQFEGVITNHMTHFFGLCPECKNTKNQM